MGVDQMGRGLRVSTPRPALFCVFLRRRRNLVNGFVLSFLFVDVDDGI